MVHLIQNYYLTADKRQYIVGKLKERRRDDHMTTELMEPSYHPTLAAAIIHVADEVLRHDIASDELDTLEAVADRYQLISNALTDQLDAAPRELRKKVNDIGN